MDILITGANGLLGGKIMKCLIEASEYGVIAVASSEEKIFNTCHRESIDYKKVRFLSNNEFLNPNTELEDVYGAVHLAFSRRNRPASEIASSLVYASSVFHKLNNCNISHVINVSSQGIYGNTPEIRTEKTPPAPETQYTMAKYASEIIFNEIFKECPCHTNIRLDLVAQSQNVIKGLCNSAKNGRIFLKGGKQIFSFIDAEDAASAIVKMLDTDGKWDSEYNVGWNCKRYSLMDLAEVICNVAEQNGYARPVIELEQSDLVLWAGMNSTRFTQKTKWYPQVELGKTIEKMIRE